MPCAFCNDAVSREDPSRVDVRQAADVEATTAACIYCRMISSVFRDHNVDGGQRIHVCNDTSAIGATHGIMILVKPPGSQYGTHFDFAIRNLKGLEGASLVKLLYSGPVHTGSHLAQSWAKKTIQNCSDNHPACKTSPHALPDRVLFLANKDENDSSWLTSDVKLYEANGKVETYAALSHRWGTKKPLQLLHNNLMAFKSGITWGSLPLTFQQAINFARRLGIHYLWIDSLCIIQDSREDWKTQSTKMASIYEHAAVTLAASVAKDGEAGCFNHPPPFMTGYIAGGVSRASPHDIPRVLEIVRANQDTGLAFIKGLTVPTELAGHPPLLTRGWVYQERLLSPRILHFGHVRLWLECSMHTEFYGGETSGATSRSIRTHPPKLQHANALGHGPFPGVGGHVNAYAERWCSIIEEYSALDLTFASDRLPAVAGLARQMARYMPEARYMCGIWSDRLVVYLAWCRGKDIAKDSCPVPRSGPSWSWATMPGSVQFPPGSFYVQRPVPGFKAFSNLWPTVEGIDVDHDDDDGNSDTFMAIQDGSITLHGALVEVRLRMLLTERGTQAIIVPLDAGSETISEVSEITLDHEPDQHELGEDWRPVESSEYTRSIPLSQVERPASGKRMEAPQHFQYAVPIKLSQSTANNVLQYYGPLWAFCLGEWWSDPGGNYQYLLLECIDSTEGTFRRIGQGSCRVTISFFKDIKTGHRIILR